MSKKKIFNDPIYGFISYPYEIIYDIIDHPYFQRLRRIGQMGLSHYIYPGALHTRFHHALGSLHLTTLAIQVLKEKEIEITEEEAIGTSIAILLHDIGHGPFSHALEGSFINASHEDISLAYMKEFNIIFEGKLDIAIQIFQNQYHKKFLSQLVSSQLDMDRLDYLTRDSFFTGVAEGVISYDRIIKMLNVRNNELVVEEKGIYSVEKFLMSRRLMYWQVYLHKTSIATEQMLIKFMSRFTAYAQKNEIKYNSDYLSAFLMPQNKIDNAQLFMYRHDILANYSLIDDYDIYSLLKKCLNIDNFVLRFLAKGLINRNIFKIKLFNEPIACDLEETIRLNVQKTLKVTSKVAKELIISGSESNQSYTTSKDEIKILYKSGEIFPLSSGTENVVHTKTITKYFICYPK